MKFPVLRINNEHIQKFRSTSDLYRIVEKYLTNGGFGKGTFIIDYEGKKYQILCVKKIRRSWHVAYWFAPSPVVIVDVNIGDPTQLSLDDIKTLVVDLIVRNKWYRQGGESEQEFRDAFSGFQSVAELIDNISFYGKWQG